MPKFTQLENDKERNDTQICLTSQAMFLTTAYNHLPFLFPCSLSSPHRFPSTVSFARFPACMPKLLWLVIAGSSPCQVNVSNQSPSPGHENQPIRAVSRCLTTQRQPERQSAIFSSGGWALANMLREAPLFQMLGGGNLTTKDDLKKREWQDVRDKRTPRHGLDQLHPCIDEETRVQSREEIVWGSHRK